MTFLQLCQRAATECGVASNSAIQTVLPTVVGATGSLGRIVNWVGDAWGDIQCDSDEWTWMRSSSLLGHGVAFQTVSGIYSYPLGAGLGDFNSDFGPDFGTGASGTVGVLPENFGKWDRDTFRCFTTEVITGQGEFATGEFSSDFPTGSGITTGGFGDEMFLDEIPYDVWRNGYMLGAMRRVRTRPYVIAVGPDQSLCLGPPPNGNYTITGDYWVAPSNMVNDTDIPLGLPTRFQMIIVYRAMQKYAGYESAPEVMERATKENDGMYAQLMNARAPRMAWAGALA